jgi:hypothetical protein
MYLADRRWSYSVLGAVSWIAGLSVTSDSFPSLRNHVGDAEASGLSLGDIGQTFVDIQLQRWKFFAKAHEAME